MKPSTLVIRCACKGLLTATTLLALASTTAMSYADDKNTSTGTTALGNVTGTGNTADGFQALYSDTSGNYNTAAGDSALYTNTTSDYNTAFGYAALFANTTGEYNAAFGVVALKSNTTGLYNTAFGDYSLNRNTTGTFDMGDGIDTLFHNTTGDYNSASGAGALIDNTTGDGNVGDGFSALPVSTSGNYNIGIGYYALAGNTTGGYNIGIGYYAGKSVVAGTNNIDIAATGTSDESGTIRIGTKGTHLATFIAGISGVAVSGSPVVVGTNGQLGIAGSSSRFKDNVCDMRDASEAILSLRPVTFHYKQEVDPKGISQFGLIAEEVEKVNPDLVVRDAEGKVFTVRYDAVNAMLLNEFLKQHSKVQELSKALGQQETAISKCESKLSEQEKINVQLTAMLKEQASMLQKVSGQLEASKLPMRTVANLQ